VQSNLYGGLGALPLEAAHLLYNRSSIPAQAEKSALPLRLVAACVTADVSSWYAGSLDRSIVREIANNDRASNAESHEAVLIQAVHVVFFDELQRTGQDSKERLSAPRGLRSRRRPGGGMVGPGGGRCCSIVARHGRGSVRVGRIDAALIAQVSQRRWRGGPGALVQQKVPQGAVVRCCRGLHRR
jgi:hypothetical protein